MEKFTFTCKSLRFLPAVWKSEEAATTILTAEPLTAYVLCDASVNWAEHKRLQDL